MSSINKIIKFPFTLKSCWIITAYDLSEQILESTINEKSQNEWNMNKAAISGSCMD